MKFNEAFEIAMAESADFRGHVDQVREAQESNGRTGCLIFSIGDESFYYGFDGLDIVKGKHSAKRSAYLINRGETLVIR